MKYTKQDIIRMADEEDVEFIRLQFTDMFGTLKNVAITRSQLEKALNNQCMFDGSSIEGFVRIEESDMYLYPDLDTFTIFPWRPQQGKVARIICDVYCADGTPFEGDPRYVLRKEITRAAKMGYTFDVGPECEFFLFHTDDNGQPTTVSHEKAGYFDLGPVDLGENARRDMVLTLEDMGFEIEASHHEVAPAQHEIDFRYDEALATADKIMTFKLAVKTIAKRHGLFASFMPKPKYGINGSGMHINMSLATKEGKNIFADETSEIETIIALDIPSVRAFMHLDTVCTQVDHDKFTIHPGIMQTLRIFEIKPGDQKGQLKVTESDAMLSDILAKYLELDKVTLIKCGGKDRIASEREQWNDGSNTLCIEPGKVVVYDRNYVTNEILRQHGIEVLEMASSELSRGRGGPRCMSMPLEREV